MTETTGEKTMALKSASDVTIRDGKAWKRWEHREGHWERLCWSEACEPLWDFPDTWVRLPH